MSMRLWHRHLMEKQALEMILEQKAGCGFYDIKMPFMDGLSVIEVPELRELRQNLWL